MEYEASGWPLTSVGPRSIHLQDRSQYLMQTKNTNHGLQVPEYPGRCGPEPVQSFPSVDNGLLRDEAGSSVRPFLPPKPSLHGGGGCRPLPPYKDPPPLPETLPPGSLPPTETSLSGQPLWCNTSGPRTEVEDQPPIPCLSQAMRNQQRNAKQQSTTAQPPAGPKMDAWAQEEKGTKAAMTERLGSLQNRLRSLLIHGPAEARRSEKVTQLPASKPPGGEQEKLIENQNQIGNHVNGIENPALNTAEQPMAAPVSSSPMANRPLPLPGSTNQDSVPPSTTRSEQRHQHHYQQPHSEENRSTDKIHHQHQHQHQQQQPRPEPARPEDTVHLRDACNKLFGRDTGQYWNNYSSGYSQGRNLKGAYETDKVTQKETIVGPMPFGQTPQLTHVQYLLSNEEISRREPTSTSTPKTVVISTNGTADAGSDQGVKSSSESGRGTYLGSTPKTSSVQLDSSLDSDQSAGVGALWRQRSHSPPQPPPTTAHAPPPVQSRHIHHHSHQHPWSSEGHLDHLDLEGAYAAAMMDGACSESTALSVTPPLPPTTPPNGTRSPTTPGRIGKMSVSSPMLSTTYETLRLHGGRNSSEEPPTKSTSRSGGGKRSSVSGGRKSACPPGSTYRVWEQGKVRGSKGNMTSKSAYSLPPAVQPPTTRGAFGAYEKNKDYRIQLMPSNLHDLADGDVTSTTTGLDMESLLDDEDDDDDDDDVIDNSSDISGSVMTEDTEAMTREASGGGPIHKQIQGLESMYGEILKLLGVRGGGGGTSGSRSKVGSTADLVKASRRHHPRHHGSFSSLSGRPGVVTGVRQRERRSAGHTDRTTGGKHAKESKNSPASKRLQRLESHVVTLARSVAHLSSEMRTQHMLVQELETIRQDLSCVQEQLGTLGVTSHQHRRSGGGDRGLRSSQHHLGHTSQQQQQQQQNQTKDWERFRCEILELINPGRVRKLTKFFGDEPPLLRQFLKKLGYEKYASNFEAEKIGITELPYLTEERLQKIGVPMGPRVRILQEAQQSFRQDHLNIYIV